MQGGGQGCYSTGSMSEKPFLNSDLMVAWSKLTPARARVEIREAIEQAKEAVATICAVEAPTYENTFAALEASGAAVMRGWQRLLHLSSVMDSPELREVINELMPEVVIYSSSITLNPQLYAVLKKAAAMPWVAELSEVKQRFIRETLCDFRENGADLSDDAVLNQDPGVLQHLDLTLLRAALCSAALRGSQHTNIGNQ